VSDFDLPVATSGAPPPPVAPRPFARRRRGARPSARDVGVVIVAGGRGARAGSEEPKQFRWVAGKPMLLHSVQTFMARADVHTVVVVLPRTHAADPPPWLFQCDVDRLLVSVGGRERADSVANGLEDVPEECAVVLVHDAARPSCRTRSSPVSWPPPAPARARCPALPVVDHAQGGERRGARDPTPSIASACGAPRRRRGSRAPCSTTRTRARRRKASPRPTTAPCASASATRWSWSPATSA
jgi:hypothetical protein